MRTLDDAIVYVEAIPGRESIFNDADRIAMPDEVIRLQTGTERDRELLLRVLQHWLGE
jgi:hypothetical protein